MCLVEEIKSVKPLASCAVLVASNMQIYTNTALVKKAREGVLEFLLVNHPLDCPICDQGGECDLQDHALVFGSDRGRFYDIKRAVEDKECGPLVKTIMTRCIHCTRCVRFATEIAGINSLGITGRGNKMEIGFYIEKLLESEISGNVIDLCPVGALTSKPFAFTARSWELQNYKSIDLFDAIGSSINVSIRGSNIMRIIPRSNKFVNDDWISDKMRFMYDSLKYQRLLKPMIKINDKFIKVSWLFIFKYLKSYLLYLLKNAQMNNFKFINVIGIFGEFIDLESLFLFKNFLNKLGTSNIYSSWNFTTLKNIDYRSNYLFNKNLINIQNADCILLVGINLRLESPILNIKIRKSYLNNCPIYSLGFNSILNYYTKQLGTNMSVLINILEGRHWFCKKLVQSKNPIILIGSSLLLRHNFQMDLNVLNFKINKYSDYVLKQNTIVNYIYNNLSQINAYELGCIPGTHSQSIQYNPYTFIYLLGADSLYNIIHKTKHNLIVYQGHHGDTGIYLADVILPSSAYFEKNGLYITIDGRICEVNSIFGTIGLSKSDWKIIQGLNELFDLNLSYYTQDLITKRIKKLIGLNKNSTLINNFFIDIKKSILFWNFKTTISSFFYNPYNSDVFARSSKILAKCNSYFTYLNNNY